jgi:hypothetical protein
MSVAFRQTTAQPIPRRIECSGRFGEFIASFFWLWNRLASREARWSAPGLEDKVALIRRLDPVGFV